MVAIDENIAKGRITRRLRNFNDEERVEPVSLQRSFPMRVLNIVTLLLIIVGGLNWLLVGVADFDLVAAIFGGQDSALATIVYVLVGLSALWQLVPFSRSLSVSETRAEANLR
jgi:uncharacterized membrane protein YuzA (DUF378 family)